MLVAGILLSIWWQSTRLLNQTDLVWEKAARDWPDGHPSGTNLVQHF